jgi:hypothetical protein
MTTVVLHLGAMKTGTSFLQEVLSQNAAVLREQGVLWPGTRWGDQVRGVTEALAGREGPRWPALLAEIDAWSGPTAILSMEFMAGADAPSAQRLLRSLAAHRVRVVLGARDLGRTIPAQWQESVQTGSTWTYTEYLDGVQAWPRTKSQTGRHFWRRQDWLRTLRHWSDGVAPEDRVLLTIPPPGSARGLLLERFAEACGFDTAGFVGTGRTNEAVGAVSAELMRRVNLRAVERGLYDALARDLKRRLSKDVLAGRKTREPALALPPSLDAFVVERTAAVLAELRTLGLPVVGSLDDLAIPPATVRPEGALWDPDGLSDGALLDAALDGVLGLVGGSAS